MTDAADAAPPESDHLRVHYGMSGSVPLRLFEFVFEPAGCYVLDCGGFTPMFDLARGRHTRRAAHVDAVYHDHGLAGLLASADTVTWFAWERVERVVLHDGGRFTRPKLRVVTGAETPSPSVRLHDVDVAALSTALERFEERVRVERSAGAGLL
jgi:hypothetical protein